MYERSLNVAESILQTTDKPWLSVRDLWEEVVRRSKKEIFEVAPLAEFTAMLDADNRFQIIPAHKEGEPLEDIISDTEIDMDEMEQLGFYPEDRVRLKAKKEPIYDDDEELPINENEEEMVSIRRRSFVDEVSKALKAVKKKTAKKTSLKKGTTARKKKQVKNSSKKKVTKNKKSTPKKKQK